MEIGSRLAYSQIPGIKPQKPAAPTPPPGGNVENRQPPREPPPPAATASATTATRGTRLNIVV